MLHFVNVLRLPLLVEWGPQVHIFPPIQTAKGDFDEEKVWEMAWTGWARS